MQPVGELVRLRAQRVGEAVDAKTSGEARELGRVAQGGDVADLAPAHEDRPAARDQHAVSGEQDLVLILEPARQELEQPSWRQNLRHFASHAIGGQREQPSRLVVGQSDGAVAVGCDRAFVDALQAGLALFEKARDLVRLEPERLTFQTRREEPRGDEPDGQRWQQCGGEAGQLADQALAQRRLQKADRNHADYLALGEDRRLAAGGNAQRATLDPDPRLAGEDGARILVDGLADQSRIGVGVSDAVGVSHHHVARESRTADLLSGLLDEPVRVAAEKSLLDRCVLGDRLRDRQRALLGLPVELLAGLPDRSRGADERRQKDDRDLENQDLIGERQPSFHVRPTRDRSPWPPRRSRDQNDQNVHNDRMP